MSDDDVLPEMRLASDEVLAATTEILLDRRLHAATGEDRERYNEALGLTAQVRDERRLLAREVADVPIPVAALVADLDDIEPLVVRSHRPPPRESDIATFVAIYGGRMDGLDFLEGEAVPVADLAEAMRSTPELVRAEAEALGVLVGCNWAGRVSIPARDAYGLLTGAARRDRTNQSDNARFNQLADEWVAERQHVTSEAYLAVMSRGDSSRGDRETYVTGVPVTPERTERAQRAANAAGAKFERACPDEIRPRVHMLYSAPSVLASVRDRVAGLMDRREFEAS